MFLMRWRMYERRLGGAVGKQLDHFVQGPVRSKSGDSMHLPLKNLDFRLGQILSMRGRSDGLIDVDAILDGRRTSYVLELRHMTNDGEPLAQFSGIVCPTKKSRTKCALTPISLVTKSIIRKVGLAG